MHKGFVIIPFSLFILMISISLNVNANQAWTANDFQLLKLKFSETYYGTSVNPLVSFPQPDHLSGLAQGNGGQIPVWAFMILVKPTSNICEALDDPTSLPEGYNSDEIRLVILPTLSLDEIYQQCPSIDSCDGLGSFPISFITAGYIPIPMKTQTKNDCLFKIENCRKEYMQAELSRQIFLGILDRRCIKNGDQQ